MGSGASTRTKEATPTERAPLTSSAHASGIVVGTAVDEDENETTASRERTMDPPGETFAAPRIVVKEGYREPDSKQDESISAAERLALEQAIEESNAAWTRVVRDAEDMSKRAEENIPTSSLDIECSVESLAVARAMEESKRLSANMSTTTRDNASTTVFNTRHDGNNEDVALALAIEESKKSVYRGRENVIDEEQKQLALAIEHSKISHDTSTSTKNADILERECIERAIQLSKLEDEEHRKRRRLRMQKEEDDLRNALALSLALSESAEAVSSISNDLLAALEESESDMRMVNESDRQLKEALERSKHETCAYGASEHVSRWLQKSSDDVEVWVIPKNALPTDPRSKLAKLATREQEATKEREKYVAELKRLTRNFAKEKEDLQKRWEDRSRLDTNELEKLRSEKASLVRMEERARSEAQERLKVLEDKETEAKRSRQEFERALKQKDEEAERERAAIHDEWESKFRTALEAKEAEMQRAAEDRLSKERAHMDAKLERLTKKEEAAAHERSAFAAKLTRRTEELEREKQDLQKRWEDRSRMTDKQVEALREEKQRLKDAMERMEIESQRRLAELEDKETDTKRSRQEFERALKQKDEEAERERAAIHDEWESKFRTALEAKEAEVSRNASERLSREKAKLEGKRVEALRRLEERESHWAQIDKRRDQKIRQLMRRVDEQDRLLATREEALKRKSDEALSTEAKQSKILVKSSTIIGGLKRELAEQRAKMEALKKKWADERAREQENFLAQAKALEKRQESKYSENAEEESKVLRRNRVRTLMALLRRHAWSVGRRVVAKRRGKLREAALKELLALRASQLESQETKLQVRLAASKRDDAVDKRQYDRTIRDLEKAREKHKRTTKKLAKYKKKLESVREKAQHKLEEKLRSASERTNAEFEKRMEDIRKMNEMLRQDLERERQLRKKYHSEVEALRGKIRVICRMRCQARDEDETCVRWSPDDENFVVITDGDEMFEFDAVALSSDRDSLWKRSGLSSLICTVVDGYNICACSYGPQCGKKETMLSSVDGMLSRSCASLFDRVNGVIRGGIKIDVFASAIEICGQSMLDMLRPQQSAWGSGNLSIDFEKDGSVRIKNATRVRVRSARDLRRAFTDALRRRRAIMGKLSDDVDESGAPNDTHVILQAVVERSDSGERVSGKFTFVDLADSDAPGRSGTRALDGGIARNFESLARITEGLAGGAKATHLNYRADLLTRALRDCIGGNAKTVFILSVGDAKRSSKDSIRAIRYALKIRDVRNETHRTADLRALAKLRGEI